MYSALIEGLLFVSGDEGLTRLQLSEIIGIDPSFLEKEISLLVNNYEKADRGIRIEFFGDSIKLVTKREFKDYLKKLVPDEEDLLTQSNLETLAIIAYNQPITRIGVENIRGVSSSHSIRKLMMRDLVKELGRSDLPGKPILYGTTDFFLDYFGISSLNQLPKIEIPDSEDIETNLYESKYKEN